ncbi:MAG: hypothetical protein IJ761_07015 [Bacteroidales bacterium]|nr:hypothetical protein [Bacteroidales bacterium]
MKKALFTLALAAFAIGANAQFVVGGNINFNTNGGRTTDETIIGSTTTNWEQPSTAYTTLEIMPKIGYQIDNRMQVGAQFGISYNAIKDYSAWSSVYTNPAINDFEGWTRTSSFGFTFAPYFRYNIATISNFTLFCEAQLKWSHFGRPTIHNYNTEYTFAGITTPSTDTTFDGTTRRNQLDITVVPGLNYNLGSNISVDLYIDLLGIGFTHNSSNTFNDYSTPSTTNTNENVRTSNNFYLLANANAQDLNAHLGLFRIGFNYHF